MKKSYFLVLLVLIFSACTCKQKTIADTLNKDVCINYETHFFNKYKGYQVSNLKQKGLDFVADYKSFCKIENCKATDYEVIQAYQIFKTKEDTVKTTFDYELAHFYNSQKMDSIIQAIKTKNCIDETTMKIHRIYKVGNNLIIGVSFYNFDIVEYENFLFKEFDKNVTIDLINVSN